MARDRAFGLLRVIRMCERSQKEQIGAMEVLVIEDNLDLREMIIEVLELQGFDAVAVGDGGEALRLLRNGTKPSLILLDRSTPVLDGPAFLKAAAGVLSGIPVVWMTGADDDRPHPSVVATLRKPFLIEDLLQLVRSHALP